MLVGWMGPFHEGNEQLQRDEAMRSIGIAAQTPMLAARSLEVARGLCEVDFEAHRGTKQKIRAEALRALRAAIESELSDS